MPETAKALQKRPILMSGLQFYIDAYQELLTERQIGMIVGPIPWSKIVEWGQFYELDDDEISKLCRFIQSLGQIKLEK